MLHYALGFAGSNHSVFSIEKKSKPKKPVAKKVVAKSAPKKTVAKPVAKKITAKPDTKKATPKAIVKVAPKVAVKVPVKKATEIAKTKILVAPKKVVVQKAAVKPTATKPTVAVKQVAPQPMVSKDKKEVATAKAHQASEKRHQQEAKTPMETKVVRYSDADLAVFKEVIQRKIAKAKEEIDFYTDQIRTASESETQFASIDDGSMTSERENMNQIVVRMLKLVSHLESALVRIENKSYGICRETGRLIPKERLLVVPHATLSVEGKKMEKK